MKLHRRWYWILLFSILGCALAGALIHYLDWFTSKRSAAQRRAEAAMATDTLADAQTRAKWGALAGLGLGVYLAISRADNTPPDEEQ